jgi:Protein of unknown function (DUF3606)
MLKTSPIPNLDRNRVDLSTKDLTRHWCKHFGKSKDDIEAAIAKVGDNADGMKGITGQTGMSTASKTFTLTSGVLN